MEKPSHSVKSWLTFRFTTMTRKLQGISCQLKRKNQSSSALTWGSLPPEVEALSLLEIILKQVIVNTDILKGWTLLLKFRRVNVHWKQVTDVVLEQQQLLQWKTFRPDDNSIFSSKILLHTSPTAQIIDWNGKDFNLLNYVECPPALNVGSTLTNPFPTSSLLVKSNRQFMSDPIKPDNVRKIQMVALSLKLGYHLTSFILHDVQVLPSHFEKILCFMSNLKAITLSEVSFKQEQDQQEKDKKTIVISQNLNHLKWRNCDVSEILDEWLQRLLEACSTQLITLELKRIFPTIQIPFTLDQYPNLRHLTIDWPNKSCFLETEIFRLECLSVRFSARVCNEHITLQDLMSFVEKFASTLVYLHVRIGKREHKEGLVELLKSGVIFPRLRTLDIPMNRRSSGIRILKEMIAPKFPNLKHLRCHYDQHFSYHHEDVALQWKNEFEYCETNEGIEEASLMRQ